MTTHRTVCPYDCPDACGLLVTVERDASGREHVVRVTGNPEHPFTRGTLCPKMAHYERTIHHPTRLLTPLLRMGKKGKGEFRPISWDEALSRIAENWKETIQTCGGEAILPYSYAGTMGLLQHDAYHALFHAIGASLLDRTICTPAKRAAFAATLGGTRAISPKEAQESDLIILWGLSLLSTNIHFQHDVEIARKKGAKVVTVETYETPTAQWSDETYLVKSGTDGALALGLAHILDRDGHIDRDFIAKYVHGWEEIRQEVLPRYTPDAVALITGLSIDAIERLAHLYAHANAPFIRLGSGLSRYTNGSMTCRLIEILPAIRGAWAKAGGGLLSSISASGAFKRDLVKRPDFLEKNVRTINMIDIGDALTGALPETQELPIKSLFIYSSNPATTAPDLNKVLAGLSRDDLFTVVHERFMTETAKYADIILPATTSVEHDDVYAAYGHYTIGTGYKILEPIGASRSNWNTAKSLAQVLGLTDPFFMKNEYELTQELINSLTWDLPVDTEVIKNGIPVELPLPAGYKLDIRTPTGKIELVSTTATPHLPNYFPPVGDDAPFWLVNSPDPRILDSSFNEREELTKSNVMLLFMHPEDASALSLSDGERVTCSNERGEADFTLKITKRTPRGVIVSEGVWWQAYTLKAGINALTSQRHTDRGAGSTFYDVCVHVKRA